MSTTIASVTEISKRYRLIVHIPINHRAIYHQDVNSVHPDPSQELTDQFTAYTADYENGVKDGWTDWHQKDTSRNGSFTLEPKATPGEYICHVQFDIVNAIALTEVIVDTDLEGSELTALLQANADAAGEAWISGRNLQPIP